MVFGILQLVNRIYMLQGCRRLRSELPLFGCLKEISAVFISFEKTREPVMAAHAKS